MDIGKGYHFAGAPRMRMAAWENLRRLKMTRTSGSVTVGGLGVLRCAVTPALVGLLTALPARTSRAATTPVFQNNNASPIASVLFGDHDIDMTAVSPPDTISNMPNTGLIPATATLLSPWPSTGLTLTSGTGSSRGKAGAGHTEGSNLAKITFPSGMGLDQTDPSHVLGGSHYRETFNFVWALNGTLGPPMSGAFSVPLGVRVGTGPGAYAKFEWDIHWDARINNLAVPDVRAPFTGSRTYTGAGTYVDSVTAPGSTFTPPSIAGGNGNLIVMRGYVGFEANNDDSRTLIEILSSTLKDVDDQLRADPQFQLLYNDPGHPEFRVDASTGFEEQLDVPEPSSALVSLAGSAILLMRRKRKQHTA
jgi:hypothetical protein